MNQPISISIAAQRIDITPPHPVSLASSPYRRPSRGVLDPLEANLLLVRQGSTQVLFVSLDLLYAGPLVKQTLIDELGSNGSISVIVGASHTHYAPVTFFDKPGLGEAHAPYIDALLGQLRSSAREMVDNETSPETQWRTGSVSLDHSINRRRRTEQGVRMAPNSEGPRDELASMVAIGAEHDPIAVLWNYACHPVSHPTPGMVSSHFPGVVRERLRQRWGNPTLPVLFFQGFSGDTRPAPTTRIRNVRDLITRLRIGPGFYDMSPRAYRRWTTSLADAIERLSRRVTPADVTDLRVSQVQRPLSAFVHGGRERCVDFSRVDLSPGITMIGGEAEFVSEFAHRVRRHPGVTAPAVLPVGCLGDTFGYLPSEKMTQEGGYEAGGYCGAFNYSGSVSSGSATGWSALVELMTAEPT